MIKIEDAESRSVIEKVCLEGHEHVFKWWDELTEPAHKKLVDQLQTIDFTLLKELRKKCLESAEINEFQGTMEPVEVIPIPRSSEQQRAGQNARILGEKVIRDGKLGAFLVAGGQGTRLDFDGPKGMFPIGPVTGKSLFQNHAEKILAANRAYGVTIPWYIMTSETNDEETQSCFFQHRFFGLNENDVYFLKQRMLPALDEKGKLILDRKDHVFMNPNGHGGSLLALVESGAVDDMRRRGVEILSYFQVDNVLIRIVDPAFIGYHVQAGAEMSSKMVRKRDPRERVGVFGRVDRRLRVVEYSDMSEEEKKATHPDGSLKYGAGSIAIHLIDVDLVESEARGGFKLPYHVAHKKIPFLNEEAEYVVPERPNGYKFETFVFDALGDTTNSVVMEVAREEEFSPVKNQEGEDSPETAVRDLSNYFGRWLEAAGVSVPRNNRGDVDGFIEISPFYAMNRSELLKKISGSLSFESSLYIGPE